MKTRRAITIYPLLSVITVESHLMWQELMLQMSVATTPVLETHSLCYRYTESKQRSTRSQWNNKLGSWCNSLCAINHKNPDWWWIASGINSLMWAVLGRIASPFTSLFEQLSAKWSPLFSLSNISHDKKIICVVCNSICVIRPLKEACCCWKVLLPLQTRDTTRNEQTLFSPEAFKGSYCQHIYRITCLEISMIPCKCATQ